ncbi:MAG: glycosyltransferase family 4 protein [Planctomycetota bacterium]
MSSPKPLLYVLHSGNLYGTERMALATLEGLRDSFDATVMAPAGPVHGEAKNRGYQTQTFSGALDFVRSLRRYLSQHREFTFVATGVVHSLSLFFLNALYRRKVVHLHMVHGGTDEKLSYGRKRKLNGKGVTFVAVSKYVRERLIANGVRSEQIEVVENFLEVERIEKSPVRDSFSSGNDSILDVIVISRVDPIKRVDVLLDALDAHPSLQKFQFRVFGTGWDFDSLSARAKEKNPNVSFEGFCDEIPTRLKESDLLLHLCPVEPFGLAILEAMATRIPVLVPNAGGAGSLVDDNETGFVFTQNDPNRLAARLEEIASLSAEQLDETTRCAHETLWSRFSPKDRTEDYRRLFQGESLCQTPANVLTT